MGELITSLQVPEDIDYSNEQSVISFLQVSFPGINPTEQELFNGKLQAYRMATERIKKQQDDERRERRIKELTEPPTLKFVREKAWEYAQVIAAAEGFNFELDEENEHVFNLLCLYFAMDKRFEDYDYEGVKYSLNKGIWLQSSTRGTGKSVMLRLFQFNKRICFAYKHISELVSIYQKRGHEGIDFFTNTIPQPSSASNYFQKEAGVMFDEIFDDSITNFMGTPLLISKHIITKLYDSANSFKGQFWKFHVTSNYDGKDIEEKFGKNVRSRMPEMFNLIKLEGSNRRTK